MKKKSFFERLAGNLRFDDSYEEEDIPIKNIEQKRELSINNSSQSKSATKQEELDEEVGELPVDMYENGNDIVIQTLIAGVLPENLSINITRDMVSITGKREPSKNISDENYQIRELYWGAFARQVDLPDEVDISQAEAIEKHGMLIIKLPKIDKHRKAMLKIKSI
jgi:HSP20 family protein